MRDGEFAHKAGLFGRLEKTKDVRGYIGCGIKKVNERQLEAERTEQTMQNKKAYRKGWLNGFCIGFGSGVAVALFK